MKRKTILKAYQIPIYNQWIYFGVAEELIDLQIKLKNWNIDKSMYQAESFAGYATNTNGVISYYICMKYDYELDYLTHEVKHITDYLFKNIGCTDSTDEPAAYFSGWLIKKYQKFYDKIINI